MNDNQNLYFEVGSNLFTKPFQNHIDLKPPLVTGFFLGGLVIHGGRQVTTYIEPDDVKLCMGVHLSQFRS